MTSGRTQAALRAVATSYVTRFLSVLIGFLVTPIVLGYLGSEFYGYWAVMASLLGYLGMADFGITGSVGTLIARVQKDGTGRDMSWIASNAIVAHTVSGLIALCCGLVVAWSLPSLLRVSLSERPLVGSAMALAAVALAVTFPTRTLKAALRGTQHIATAKTTEFVLYIFRTALTLVMLTAGLSLISLPLSSLLVGVVGLAVFYVVTRKTIPEFVVNWSEVSIERIRRILTVSLWWFVGGLGSVLIYQTDNIVVGRLLGPSSVAVYALTSRVPGILRDQIFELNRALMPGVGDLVGRGNLERVQEVYLLALRVILFLSISAGCFVYLYNGAILAIWVGSEYFGGDFLSLILGATVVYLAVFSTSSLILTSMLDLRVLARVRLVEGLVNLVLSLIFIRYVGLVGVALGTLVAGLLTTGWAIPFRACHLLHLKVSKVVSTVGVGALKFLMLILPGVFLLDRTQGDLGGALMVFFSLGLATWMLTCGALTLVPIGDLRSLWGIGFRRRT